jgi:hypothetical protein
MNTVIPLTDARNNLSELVNQTFYEGKLFSISKGKKPMSIIVGAREWKDIIRVIEEHDQGLADTLAIMADPELQVLLEEGQENIRTGNLISMEQVEKDIQDDK